MAPAISWVCATASARGSSHALSDTENQDASATFETDDGVAVAVADGHGGRRYMRSATGSSIAVEVARQLAAELLRSNADLTAAAAAAWSPRIVAEWRRRVDADLATHPLEQADATLVGDDPRFAYGATLLLVVCRGDEAVALQLGDGDVVVAWDDGTVTSPVPAEPRNVGGHTTSLCLPDAERSFRVAELGRDGVVPVAILAASDGYGNSFEHDDWAPAVMRDLLEQRRSGALDSIFSAMPTWVAESAGVGGDDTTVALVFRSGSPVRVPAATPRSAAPPTPASATEPRPARRWAGLALAGVVGLAVGSAVGIAVSGDGDSGTASSTTLPAVASSDAPPTTPTPTRPSASAAQPPTSPPSTSTNSIATTLPPSSAPATTTTPSTTLPPVADPVVPADRSVVMVAGPYQVALDPFSDPIAIESVGPGQGVTPIIQLLTTGGRWEAVDASLRFTPRDGSTKSAWELDGTGQIEGLAFSAGRVVAVAVSPSETGDVLTVGVFDGATGDQLAISAQVATGDGN